MAQDTEKKVEEVVKATKNIKKEQEELKKSIEKSTESYQKSIEAIKSYVRTPSFINKEIEKIIDSTVRLNVDVHKLAKTHKDGYEYLSKKNKAEIEANTKQIEGLSKNISKHKELADSYKTRSELIVEQGMIAKAELEEEYKLLGQALIGQKNYDAEYSQLITEQNAKLLAIDKETKKQLLQNAFELHTTIESQAKTSVDSILEHSGKVVEHSSGLWKGVIDVDAQKQHLEEAKNQLNDYLTNLDKFGQSIYSQYQSQLNDHNLTIEEKKKLEEEYAVFLEKHNKLVTEETKRVNGEVEKIERSSQSMRLQQFNQYVRNYQALNSKISEATAAVGKTFSQLNTYYEKAKTDIDEKKEDLDKEKEEKLLTEEAETAKRTELASAESALDTATTEEQKKLAQDRVDSLKMELDNNSTLKKDFENKEEGLKKEKEKKIKQQEKAKKTQEKIALGQQIVAAIGDVAAGTAKALAYGPILGPILAGIVGAAGAIQIGIMTKQLAKFEDGGLLNGKRHRDGGMHIEGTNIEVEGGEYVVNRQSTDKNLGLLHYINNQRRELDSNDLQSYFSAPLPRFQHPEHINQFKSGGQVPIVPMSNSVDTQQLLHAINSIDFQPRVAVTDIHNVQQQMTRVDEWTGM